MGKIEAVGNFSVVGKWEEVVRVGEAMGILILIFGVDFVWRCLNRFGDSMLVWVCANERGTCVYC